MKMNSKQNTIRVTLFAAALLATCLFGSPANAQQNVRDERVDQVGDQPIYQGGFTLKHETRWGKAVLPAGDYRLTIRTAENPTTFFIEDAKSGKTVAMVAPNVTERSNKGDSALLIGTRGNQRVVYSLRIAELGEVLISDPALAHGRESREEARQTEAVPVVVAKK